jgi:hypothetical protein
MSVVELPENERNWDWGKVMSWSDIARVALMLGVTPDARLESNFKLRKWLKDRIDEGWIEQVGRGRYRLKVRPEQ